MPLLSSQFTGEIRQHFDNSINALIFGIGDMVGAGIGKVADMAGSAIDGVANLASRGVDMAANAVTPNIASPAGDQSPGHGLGLSREGPSTPSLSPAAATQVAAISHNSQSITLDHSFSLSELGSVTPMAVTNLGHFQQQSASVGLG